MPRGSETGVPGDAATVVAVVTTAPDREVAERLGSTLVEERLAACVNVVPGMTSIYRWDERIQRDAELLLIIKTTAVVAPTTCARLVELHPYDVPEALTIPVPSGSAAYLEWVRDEVGARA